MSSSIIEIQSYDKMYPIYFMTKCIYTMFPIYLHILKISHIEKIQKKIVKIKLTLLNNN